MAAQPVRRYDAEGLPIRTGHTIGSAAHRLPPDDTERVQALTEYADHQRGLDTEDKDLTARFKEAFDEVTGVSHPLEEGENGLDAAIMQMNADAGERVAMASLSKDERQAKATASALADVLEERGIVAADEYDELDEPDPVEADDAGLYVDEGGNVWKLEGGFWSQVPQKDEDAEAEQYDALAEWEAGVDERRTADENEDADEDWADVA